MDAARSTTDPGRRAPPLLALVFGIFLVLVGIAASALVAVTSMHLSETTLKSVVARDRSLIDLFVNDNVTAADLDATGPDDARRVQLRAKLRALAASDEIVGIELRDRHGGVIVSTGGTSGIGPSAELLAAALSGHAGAALMEDGEVPLLEEHLPIVASDESVVGVMALQRDASSLMRGLEASGRDVMIVTLVAAIMLAAILVIVFRAAHTRLDRQHRQLVEAARRDALTGMLNHGSIVALLADELETARRSAEPINVALVDIDNFRLFNDTHGHEAGDAVLLRVAGLVAELAAPDGRAARYGPDEFLLVRHGAAIESMGNDAHHLQNELCAVSVQFGESEELPVSVSVGIAAFPLHAASVTALLSEASVALNEARASGGDAVAVADTDGESRTVAGSFDVLQGLVLAVDTKDRYTKRHSEDVARYAVFLARRMGLNDMLETVRLSGLLHDIGKIGIPDALLRKPSRLSDEEFRAFNQHVALGDAIVRDLPELDDVRAGIRHHHERWDGSGYLSGLKGEEIPLIARVIAVADAFSAMTTTRPYRKALSVAEALRRLREAAGTQLQPELVDCFVTGIETAEDAPVAGEPSDVWQPVRKVA
ncbi:MAG TPA: diguanylate cyclase [Methylomirabilota bacterium]|nr:diguanylate cyclase [Methylomirabilota bacterium]